MQEHAVSSKPGHHFLWQDDVFESGPVCSPASRLLQRRAGEAAAIASSAAAAADTAPSPDCRRRSRCPMTTLPTSKDHRLKMRASAGARVTDVCQSSSRGGVQSSLGYKRQVHVDSDCIRMYRQTDIVGGHACAQEGGREAAVQGPPALLLDHDADCVHRAAVQRQRSPRRTVLHCKGRSRRVSSNPADSKVTNEALKLRVTRVHVDKPSRPTEPTATALSAADALNHGEVGESTAGLLHVAASCRRVTLQTGLHDIQGVQGQH